MHPVACAPVTAGQCSNVITEPVVGMQARCAAAAEEAEAEPWPGEGGEHSQAAGYCHRERAGKAGGRREEGERAACKGAPNGQWDHLQHYEFMQHSYIQSVLTSLCGASFRLHPGHSISKDSIDIPDSSPDAH